MENLRGQLLDRLCVERGSSDCELIQDDSEGPNINFVSVWAVLKDLRGNIEWRSFDGHQEIGRCRHLFREAEVTDFNLILMQENILRLQVPMQDSVLMEVEHGRQNLLPIETDLIFRQLLFLLQDLGEVSPSVLHNHDELGICLQALLHRDDVVVLDFGEQLCFGLEVIDFTSCSILFGDALEGHSLITLSHRHVDLPERSLSDHPLCFVFTDSIVFHIRYLLNYNPLSPKPPHLIRDFYQHGQNPLALRKEY